MTESINAPNNVETVVNIPDASVIKCKKCVVDGYDYRCLTTTPPIFVMTIAKRIVSFGYFSD
jgi:hypothetical protein